MATDTYYFDNAEIHREYHRWCKKIGGGHSTERALEVAEVLRAHFLIAEFFDEEQHGLGGVGPRDTDGHLLHSAIARQFVSFDGINKWTDDFDIAATVLFGLVKNHPFHDGNKRTALIAVLHLLAKQGYTASANKTKFENLVVMLAEDRYHKNELYQYLQTEKTSPDDASVVFIASRLKKWSRTRDRSHRSVTYRDINQLLKPHGYELHGKHDNTIGVVRIADRQTIARVGFPGMRKQVSKGVVKKIRMHCGLTERDGYDSRAFFNGVDDMGALLAEYDAPLRRLAYK